MKDVKATTKKESIIEWRASESPYTAKTPLWYARVSIFFLLIFVLLFLLQQWIAVAIVAFLFWIFILKAAERPRTIDYRIDSDGITVDDRKIPYVDINYFTLDTTHRTPVITLTLVYQFGLPVTIVARKNNYDQVVGELVKHVPFRNDFSLLRWISHYLHY